MTSNEILLNLLNSCKLDELKAKLEANYREELAINQGKAKRGHNPLKCIEKMFKSGNQTDKRFVNTAHKQENGLYAFINGYSIFTATENYGFREAEPHELLKCGNFFPKSSDLENAFEVNKKELDLFIKTKANKPTKYDKRPYVIKTEVGVIGVNAEFLQTALEYVQTDKICFGGISDGSYLRSPLVVGDITEEVVALVLPVNVHNIEVALDYMSKWRDSHKEVLSNI